MNINQDSAHWPYGNLTPSLFALNAELLRQQQQQSALLVGSGLPTPAATAVNVPLPNGVFTGFSTLPIPLPNSIQSQLALANLVQQPPVLLANNSPEPRHKRKSSQDLNLIDLPEELNKRRSGATRKLHKREMEKVRRECLKSEFNQLAEMLELPRGQNTEKLEILKRTVAELQKYKQLKKSLENNKIVSHGAETDPESDIK